MQLDQTSLNFFGYVREQADKGQNFIAVDAAMSLTKPGTIYVSLKDGVLAPARDENGVAGYKLTLTGQKVGLWGRWARNNPHHFPLAIERAQGVIERGYFNPNRKQVAA